MKGKRVTEKYMDIIIGITAGVLLILLCTSYIMFRKLFRGVKGVIENPLWGLDGDDEIKVKRRGKIEPSMKIPSESLTITTRDGTALHGNYYHTRDGAPLAIFFHGYRSIGVRDFCALIPTLINLGYNLIVTDHRAHRKSFGKIISFGVRERLDVVDWCKFAEEKFGTETKIILVGMSMGASSVIMASQLDLPKNVSGIIADCPFSSPEEIIRKILRDRKLSPCIFYPLIRLGAIIFGGFDPSSASATQAAANTKIPILIIHGDDDRLVPVEMSEKIAQNGNTVRLVKVKNATHCTAFFFNEKLYISSVGSFLSKVTDTPT